MPEMDGEELHRRIRGDLQYDAIKLVLASSFSLAITDTGARELGFDGALPKPLRRSAMLGCFSRMYDLAISWDETGPAKGDVSVEAQQGAELRVLVVDDVTVNQILICAILGKVGYATDVASNGIEALQALNRRPYDLILMDVQMPEMDGLEATARIRKLHGDVARIPIIAMTANAMKGDRETCIQMGMNDYVSKPIVPVQLLQRIAFCVGDSQVAAPGQNFEQADSDLDAALSDDVTGDVDSQQRDHA